MYEVEYVRDGQQRILGTKTENEESGITVARDRNGRILGTSNERFQNTRAAQGRLVRSNEADTDSLFR